MTADFEKLCIQTKNTAFVLLDQWDAEPDPDIDIAAEVLKKALDHTVPSFEEIDDDWTWQILTQVPDLFTNTGTEYTIDMNVPAAVWKAVHLRIGNAIRDDIRERLGELGIGEGGPRI